MEGVARELAEAAAGGLPVALFGGHEESQLERYVL